MSDRELLEDAAKAAGIPLDSDGDRTDERSGGAPMRWNPLEDDGDALRLAVKLRLEVRVEDYGAGARIGDGGWSQCEAHLHGGVEAATRRAIVRAAAAMKETP